MVGKLNTGTSIRQGLNVLAVNNPVAVAARVIRVGATTIDRLDLNQLVFHQSTLGRLGCELNETLVDGLGNVGDDTVHVKHDRMLRRALASIIKALAVDDLFHKTWNVDLVLLRGLFPSNGGSLGGHFRRGDTRNTRDVGIDGALAQRLGFLGVNSSIDDDMLGDPVVAKAPVVRVAQIKYDENHGWSVE